MRTHWDTVLELTQSMKMAAVRDDWDEFSRCLKERQAQLIMINTHCVVSPNINIAYEIAELNNEILHVAKNKHSHLAEKLGHMGSSKKACSLYALNAK